MAYITYHNNYGKCPTWNIEVCISGKYIINEVTHKERFIKGECPILQQLKLPFSKREWKYRPYTFCNHEGDCPLLSDFVKELDYQL